MTSHLKKGPLWANPELVAKQIVNGIDNKRHTIYTPGYWRIIMTAVRFIPEILFKRMNF